MFRLLKFAGCLVVLVLVGVGYLAFHVRVSRGSGRVVTQDRSVADFDAVRLDGLGQLTIRHGGRAALTIAAEDNVLPNVTSRLENHTLILGYHMGWLSHAPLPTRPIEYTITAPRLKAVSLNGDATVEAKALKGDALDVALNGLGQADLTVEVKRLHLTIAGSGSARVRGRADDQDIHIDGHGTYAARELRSETCAVGIVGAGSATVAARRKLVVQIVGSGDLKYAGHPEVTQQISGVGKVEKL